MRRRHGRLANTISWDSLCDRHGRTVPGLDELVERAQKDAWPPAHRNKIELILRGSGLSLNTRLGEDGEPVDIKGRPPPPAQRRNPEPPISQPFRLPTNKQQQGLQTERSGEQRLPHGAHHAAVDRYVSHLRERDVVAFLAAAVHPPRRPGDLSYQLCVPYRMTLELGLREEGLLVRLRRPQRRVGLRFAQCRLGPGPGRLRRLWRHQPQNSEDDGQHPPAFLAPFFALGEEINVGVVLWRITVLRRGRSYTASGA
jgi:hypothetical protein